MDPVVVIPTFFSGKRRTRRNSSVTGVYDHATDVDAQGELDRCLTSLEAVEDVGLVMVLVAAEGGVEDRAEEKVQAAVDAHPDLNVMVIGRPELQLVRKRLEALGLPSFNHEVALQGYGAVRNLSLLLAGVLGFDAVVFLDDDEVIEDPDFLKAAMYGLGKRTKKVFPSWRRPASTSTRRARTAPAGRTSGTTASGSRRAPSTSGSRLPCGRRGCRGRTTCAAAC